MLIIPLTGKISKRNPPVITIGIILTNCFVYFFLQSGDAELYRKAYEFYLKSGLAKMEVSRYREYLIDTQGEKGLPAPLRGKELDDKAFLHLYQQMQRDKVFMKALISDRIISPQDPIYGQWKTLRLQFQGIFAMTVTQRYGFKPSEGNLVTTFTHMFLHGGFMHLLGNMVFLWLVGCVLELGCGRALYGAIYLLTGVATVRLFGLVYMDSTTPLVGASGAIAGLMGAFTMLYGKNRIRVFYSLGFYFNYAKVPAVVLLPVWIGKELFQLFFGGLSQVAYVAHVGGLASGAVLGYLNRRFMGKAGEEVFGEDPREKIPPLLEEALRRIGELDLDGARPLLEEVLEIDPHNLRALTHLFHIDKLNPEGDRFHQTASRLLLHLTRENGAPDALYTTYREYRRASKKIRLSLDLIFRIASVFSVQGYPEESEKIITMLLKKRPKYQKLPTGLLRLGQAYLERGRRDRGKKYLSYVCRRFPESPESQIARRLLAGSG